MSNNVYTDKVTGEQVTIINEDVNFYELNNKVRIKKDVFAKKYEQKTEIDPNSFFNNQYTSSDPLMNLANQIKNLDSSMISDIPDAGTKIKYTPPVVLSDNSMSQAAVKQPQIEESIILTPEEKKAMLEEWRRTQPGAQIPQVKERNWDDDDDVFLNGVKQDNISESKISKKEETKVDPIQMMFKMFKNNYPVKLNIEIEENIPNPTFIGMVQENVEADAVEYYAKVISDRLLKDPEKLKTEIYNQLKSIIEKELNDN